MEARLKYLSELVVLLAGCTAAYGWCLQKRVSIAVPLVFQVISTSPLSLSIFPLKIAPFSISIFLVGLICMAVMNATTTLMIDLAPGQGSAVAACVGFLLARY